MSLRDELRDQLCRLLFGAVVPEAELGDDDDLFAVGLDSMGILRLVAWIEKRTGKPLAEGAIRSDSFRSLRALVALVELQAA